MKRSRLLFAILFLAALSLAACGGQTPPLPDDATPAEVAPGETPVEPAPDTPTDIPATPVPADAFSGEGPWEIAVDTTDGETLHGMIYGMSEQVVILAPMYPGEQAGWTAYAQFLAANGYRAVTFDFRGHGLSTGTRGGEAAPADLAAIVSFIREVEPSHIALAGAGIGGEAAIQVASGDPGIDGLIVLSAARSSEGLTIDDSTLAALSVPSLWIGARNDLLQEVEALHAAAGGDKQLWIYEGSSLPGTYIFEGADRADLEGRLLDFLVQAFES